MNRGIGQTEKTRSIRILWLRIISDPRKSTRLQHLRRYVLNDLEGVQNLIVTGRTFETDTPSHNKIIHLKGRPRSHRKKVITLWGLLPRPLPFLASFKPAVAWHLLVGRYDVVYTYMLSSAHTILTYVIGHMIRGKPFVVMTEHWYARSSGWVNWWYRQVTSSAALVVAQSSKCEKFMESNIDVDAEKLVKCVNTVADLDIKPYDLDLVERLIGYPGRNVLCVARFSEFKGQDVLIEAIKQLNDPRVRLHLVGEVNNEYGNYCRKLADGYSNIVFWGKMSFGQVLSFYRGSDVFVLANRFTEDPVEGAESFGYAALEAAYFGLPVIATTATGCADDVVVPGVTGYVVEEGNPDDLVQALSKLLKEAAKLDRMGKAAREHARELCSESALDELKVGLRAVLSTVG